MCWGFGAPPEYIRTPVHDVVAMSADGPEDRARQLSTTSWPAVSAFEDFRRHQEGQVDNQPWYWPVAVLLISNLFFAPKRVAPALHHDGFVRSLIPLMSLKSSHGLCPLAVKRVKSAKTADKKSNNGCIMASFLSCL